MAKIIDVRSAGGDVVILGKALVLPASAIDGSDLPLDGSLRYNPDSEVVELYTQGVWAPLGGESGGGGDGAHNHTIEQVIGLSDELATKANVAHAHSFNEITGLQTALNEKASENHDHIIANVTGLQAALDGKAPLVHFHQVSDVVSLQGKLELYAKEQFQFCVTGQPAANLRYIMTSALRVDIPQNFGGSICYVRVWPTATYVIQVKHNTLPVGSITVNTSGMATMVTTNPLGIILSPGDRLSFEFPSSQDATLETVSMCILGERK